MSGMFSVGVLHPRHSTRTMSFRSTALRSVSFVLALLLSVSSFAQQDPNDLGGPDSIFLTIDKTVIGPDDSGAVVELYALNDAQTLNVVAAGFYWTNADVRLDSVVWSPLADSLFEILQIFRDGQLETTNAYQQFSFVGISISEPNLEPSSSARLMATFYFGAEDWGFGDTSCIDTLAWQPGLEPTFVELSGMPYIPAWGGPVCAWAGGFPTDCFGTIGNVMLVPECDSTNQLVDIVDLQLLIDHEFLSLTPLCWEKEADLDFSGMVDITDLQLMIDHQFLTLEPFPDCP